MSAARRWTWRRRGDLIISVDWEQGLATVHVLAAVSALLVGAAVVLMPKGTQSHRVIGTLYVLSLLVVNVAALSLHRENAFGVFHALGSRQSGHDRCRALAAAARQEIAAGRRDPRVLHVVVVRGLVAAGCGQLVVAVADWAWAVPVVIGAVLSISGVIIFGRTPSVLDPMLAE